MMLQTRIMLVACGLLVACGTPQEQCVRRNTRDARVVEQLIIETTGNLQRGYALEQVSLSTPVWTRCDTVTLSDSRKKKPLKPRFCWEDREETVTRPRAIDLAAEQRTLNGLLEKRGSLLAVTAPAIAACKAQYPE